jgi:hypothetical protein
LGDDHERFRSAEDAMPHGAVKVSLALDAAVVLPGVVFQLDADPIAGGEPGEPDEAYDAGPAIFHPDCLP